MPGPLSMHFHELIDSRTMRVSLDVSVREFMARYAPDVEQWIVKKLAEEISVKLAGELQDEMRLMIRMELAAEVKRQVKDNVTARLDEYVEDFFNG